MVLRDPCRTPPAWPGLPQEVLVSGGGALHIERRAALVRLVLIGNYGFYSIGTTGDVSWKNKIYAYSPGSRGKGVLRDITNHFFGWRKYHSRHSGLQSLLMGRSAEIVE